MSLLHFQPIKGQVRTILRAILNTPEVSSCRLKVVLTLRLVCEEIVMNVTSYAYPEGTEGYLDVDIQKVAVTPITASSSVSKMGAYLSIPWSRRNQTSRFHGNSVPLEALVSILSSV